MAANCDVCGKGPGLATAFSHSHRRTKRRWNPNIQRVRTIIGGTPKRLNVCASCLKALRRSPAPASQFAPAQGGHNVSAHVPRQSR